MKKLLGQSNLRRVLRRGGLIRTSALFILVVGLLITPFISPMLANLTLDGLEKAVLSLMKKN